LGNETNFVFFVLFLGGQPENRNLWDFKVFCVFNMGRILLEKEQPNDESELHCRSSARAPLRSAWFLRLLFFFFFFFLLGGNEKEASSVAQHL
jgi:hypothetical protein